MADGQLIWWAALSHTTHQPLAELERAIILHRLAVCVGNRQRTARSLKIGLRTLGMKLKAYGVPRGGISPAARASEGVPS